MHVINTTKYVLSRISKTKLVIKKLKTLIIIIHKNDAKKCSIAPILTLQEHIFTKRGKFQNNTTISIIGYFDYFLL